MKNQVATVTGFYALSDHEKNDHRAKVGLRARSILNGFWRDAGVSDAEQALEVEGWVEVLKGCSHSEILAAWADYQTTGPRSQRGVLLKPDAGTIYHRVMRNRPKPKPVPQAPEPDRKPATAEEAARIMAEAGFRPRKFGNHEAAE